MISQSDNYSYRDHQNAMFNKMKTYLTMTNCRRQMLLEHFNKDDASNSPAKTIHFKVRENCCDNCAHRLKNISENIKEEDNYIDYTTEAQKVLYIFFQLLKHSIKSINKSYFYKAF